MAHISIAQAQATHQQAHSAFLDHVQNCPEAESGHPCRECHGLQIDADAAGYRWLMEENAAILSADRGAARSERISLTEAGAAYLAQRQAVAV